MGISLKAPWGTKPWQGFQTERIQCKCRAGGEGKAPEGMVTLLGVSAVLWAVTAIRGQSPETGLSGGSLVEGPHRS